MKYLTAFTVNHKSKGLPVEDSFRLVPLHKADILLVADGITRDLVDDQYPIPSPAKIAADTFSRWFVNYLEKLDSFDEKKVQLAFSSANAQIKLLNQKNNPTPDYLEQDYWGCVASGGLITGKTLFYGYIADCGLAVFDDSGKLKFRTTNDKKEADKLVDFRGKDWKDLHWRKERRSKYRNNPRLLIKRKLASYGALTGQEEALSFLRTGTYTLKEGDYVFFYSDGFEPVIYSAEFSLHLGKKGLDGLEKFCQSIFPLGEEGTLVGYLVK